MRLVIPSSARTERLLSQFLVVLSRLMGILAKRLPRLLRLGAGHKHTPGFPRVVCPCWPGRAPMLFRWLGSAGAASRQRSCTYSLMRQGLCQLIYSDIIRGHVGCPIRWRQFPLPLRFSSKSTSPLSISRLRHAVKWKPLFSLSTIVGFLVRLSRKGATLHYCQPPESNRTPH